MTLVLGGGFGLYGHLAALAREGRAISAPTRYRAIAAARPELAHYVDQVAWVEDEAVALSEASSVIMARRPSENADLILTRAQRGRIRAVLEKPLAADPDEALRLIDVLDRARVQFSVPYLFRYCDWGPVVIAALRQRNQIEIAWDFTLSRRGNHWKNNDSDGGGALAFYFIHCMAFAITALPDGNHTGRWRSQDDGSADITLETANATTTLVQRFRLGDRPFRFHVADASQTLFDAVTPFGAAPRPGVADPRLDSLARFHDNELFDAAGPGPDYHRAVNQLWQQMLTWRYS